MKYKKMIEFLLNNANPSIKHRIKSEILHNINPDEAAQYQEQILREPIVQQIISCQKENGWLGNGFHGSNKNAGQFENQETGTKYLGEKAVDKNTPNSIEKMMKTDRPELINLIPASWVGYELGTLGAFHRRVLA